MTNRFALYGNPHSQFTYKVGLLLYRGTAARDGSNWTGPLRKALSF